MRLDAVGDFILTTPAIRVIRENFPSSYITLVVRKQIHPLAELCPYVNQVLAFDVNFYNGNFVFVDGILGLLNDLKEFSKRFLWQKNYQLAFSFTFASTPLNSLMLYISGAKERVAYTKDSFDNFLNTRRLLIPQKLPHECLKNLYLLESVGLKLSRLDSEVWYSKTDLLTAKKFLERFDKKRIKIVTAIGANHKERQYPVEKYLTAFKQILSKGALLIILGGSSEIEAAQFLEDNLPSGSVANLVKVNTGWRVDAAVISLVDLYIGNMTGACDVAAALKKPVITLSRVAKDFKNFYVNPTEAELFQPWKTHCIVLQPEHQLAECTINPFYAACTAGKSHCIAQIEPSEIVAAYEKILRFVKQE